MNDFSTTAGKSAPEPSRERLLENEFDLCQLRSEYFERNFYSLRKIEFQLAFQIYAGYAAIGGAFFALRANGYDAISPERLADASALLLTLVLIAGVFCQWQILRRLHFSQHMQFVYIKYLHSKIARELDADKGEERPGFRKWWAFVPMLIVNLSVYVSLLIAILLAT